MKTQFKKIFSLILCFLIGCIFYYFLSETLLKEKSPESSGISDLAYEKINLISEDMIKYENRINSVNIILAKIEKLTREIPGKECNDKFNYPLKNSDTNELTLYHEFIDPLEDLLNANEVYLNEKVYDMLTKYSGIKTEDQKVSEMKEFKTDEEISKIFYSIFPVPANKRISKNSATQNYTAKSFSDGKRFLIRDMNLLKTDLNNASKTATRKQKESEAQKNSYTEELKNLKDNSIHKITLYVALPLFAFILIAVFLIPSQYLNDKVQTLFIEHNIIKDVLTIFLLTSTIILLGLSGVIKGEIIGTLLGGISVYVLQRGLESKQSDDATKNQEEVKKQTEPNSMNEVNSSKDSKETNETTEPKESNDINETTEPIESDETNENNKV
jgi:hypothetical protein